MQHNQLAAYETALAVNSTATRGLAEVLKASFGPKGRLKMLVSGAGDIKITKDGKVLLDEMQIQHPCAQLIARTASAQDDVTGDGTISLVLFLNELMKQADWFTRDGTHIRSITAGYELAAAEAQKFLEEFKTPLAEPITEKREIYDHIAFSSVGTKVDDPQALASILVDAVKTIYKPNEPVDLHMIEIMHMQHKLTSETKFVAGLVLDHGSRHPDMPKRLENCYIMTLNVSLEWDKTEINSEWQYKDSSTKEDMARAERKTVEDRALQIVALKKSLCTPENGKTFVVINQKGIDPFALDIFAKEGIIGLRRAKRRNMERLMLACGGQPINHLDNVTEADLGWAGSVYEHVLGEEKYTFVENVRHPQSCTILIKGPNKHSIARIKDAIRDGLRALTNAVNDGAVVRGGGAFEVAVSNHLKKYAESITTRSRIGVLAFADAILCIPRTLAENSGFIATDCVIDMQGSHSRGIVVGFDVVSGKSMDPTQAGVYDNVIVKQNVIASAGAVAQQLLLVDQIVKAGARKKAGADPSLDGEAEDIAGD